MWCTLVQNQNVVFSSTGPECGVQNQYVAYSSTEPECGVL